MKKLIAFVLISLSMQANAALVSRAGGAAFYDTVLDVTWLADANYALTEDFGISGISATTGQMDYSTAGTWLTALNASNLLGINTWRLPVANPIDGSSYDTGFSEDGSTDTARNLTAAGSVYAGSTASEMANLYHNTLGNISTRDVNGDPTSCFGGNCLSNTGPFSNLDNVRYWTGSASPNLNEIFVYNFNGFQDDRLNTDVSAVWVVASGDALIPIPPALVLFPSALAALGWCRKKAAA